MDKSESSRRGRPRKGTGARIARTAHWEPDVLLLVADNMEPGESFSDVVNRAIRQALAGLPVSTTPTTTAPAVDTYHEPEIVRERFEE